MFPPGLEGLLVLQEKDARYRSRKGQLEAIPREVEGVRRKMIEERTQADQAVAAVKELEVRRKGLEAEIAATEDRVVRYKNQQMQVKKNEEYQALTHEIEAAQKIISDLEEDEIGVLFSLDDARARLSAAEEEMRSNLALHEQRLERLAERERNLKAELEAISAEVAEAREPVEQAALRLYDRLASSLALPICVPLREQRCTGCHLKVSTGVAQEVQRAEKITSCDNCGRILYWEA
jgi:uncharacterized protein